MNHYTGRYACVLLLSLPIFNFVRSQNLVPFKDKHGTINYAELDRETGCVRRIHGLSIHLRDYGKEISALNRKDIGEIANRLLADYGGVLELSPDRIRPVSIESDGGWWFAEFQQLQELLTIR